MAVSGISSSKSLYGTRNIITGLASGMDTESMIENAVSGYKLKISQLQQKRTKTEWKQEAYQSIINKMSVFSDKYTSYMSSNNLMSASFFNSAVKTVAQGKYADKVSATGRASSSVQIDRVLQLATAATYKLKGSELGAQADLTGDSVTATAGGTLDLNDTTEISKLSGTMTLTYGGSNSSTSLTINFDETKTYNKGADWKENAQALADEINRQLSEQSITIGSNTYTGNDLLNRVVKAEVGEDGNITFADPKGNNVYVSRATGSVQELLLRGEEPTSSAGSQLKKLYLGKDWNATEDRSKLSYLSGSSMEITLDGKTKTIKVPTAKEIADKVDPNYQYADALKTKILNGTALTNEASQRELDKAFMAAFQEKVDAAFGKNADGTSKLAVSDANGEGAGIQLQFKAEKGSTFSVKSSKGEVLGLGENKALTSYLNTDKTLGEIKNLDWSKFELAYEKDANGKPTSSLAKDSEGNQLYSFKVSGANGEVVEVGQFNANSKLSDVFNAMNNSEDSGVKVSYSKLTNEISFTAKDTGSNGQIKFEGLAAELFGTEDASQKDGFTAGQDAIFEASVNGTSLGRLTRSSNDVEMDGMTVTLKGTFGYTEAQETDLGAVKGDNGKFYVADTDSEAVTFQTSSDADKIVDVIKKMVEDYNSMVTEIKNAYSTMPAQQSNGSYYEPMTSEEEEKYSESFIKNWNEKAKTGLLFADRDLSSLYNSLTSAISLGGENGAVLRSAGLTVSYANGLSTLEFDEEKFRAALDKNPDKVRDAFTASTDAGSGSNGLMQALKQPLDMYGKTTGGKGILVEKAGSVLSPTSMYNNFLQQELDDIDSQITRWQDKLSDKVDYYTNQFSKLEQLVQQMNSQSSYFSQLSGG